MGRRACLAIGVSIVTPGKNKAMKFPYLDGAVLAARAIGDWALGSGFGEANVRVVTDAPVERRANPVTRQRVQHAVDELFQDGAEVVDHLIVAFCGHGLTDQNLNSISWLFSDSLTRKYRVVADAFYGELLLHGVRHITLISDACREPPKGLDLMRFDAVRGIVVDGKRDERFKLDRLAACRDGSQGFMVQDQASAHPGKCIFSGVIADVLWGAEPAAIRNGRVTTVTLGSTARARTLERAKAYRLDLSPDCLVDPDEAVLYEVANPPAGRPTPQAWPPAATAVGMGQLMKAEMERVQMEMRDTLHAGLPRLPGRQREMLRGAVEGKIAEHARTASAASLRRSLVQLRPEESNLVLVGRDARLWSRSSVATGRRTRARIGFHVAGDGIGTPVLVELDDGSFTPVVPYPGLYAVVKRDFAEDVFLAYGNRDIRQAYGQAVKAVADFAAGRLGVGSVDELAAMLRAGKHYDPVLGAICAYLYRAVADYANIRRMAYHYVDCGQPIPFDIALLGDMPVEKGGDGALILHVPEVEARPRQAGAANLPRYATRATPAATGVVGGRCPWLGIGWDYVGFVRDESAILVEGLAEHARNVPRRGFTLLSGESGRALAEAWGLMPR